MAKPVPAFLDNEVIKMFLDDFAINLIFVSIKTCQDIENLLDYLILDLHVALVGSKATKYGDKVSGSRWAFLLLFFCLKILWLRLHITMVIRNRRLFF